MTDYEKTWDFSLRIQTCGRDASGADEYHHPYEPTPYCVLERLVDSGFFGNDDVVNEDDLHCIQRNRHPAGCLNIRIGWKG